LGDKREISAFDNDARIRFLYPFRDSLRDDMVGDDIMLLRIDRKVPGTCTPPRPNLRAYEVVFQSYPSVGGGSVPK